MGGSHNPKKIESVSRDIPVRPSGWLVRLRKPFRLAHFPFTPNIIMPENIATHAGNSTGLSKRAKIVIAICALYLLSPIDILPDAIPLLGQCDDLIGFGIAVYTAMKSRQS